MIQQALSDIRIIDLSWHIAGPYCTKLLADHGADVLKVERPGTGDPARSMGPFFNDEPDPEKSGLFLHLNTNKRGITLNLKSEAGRKILRKLIEKTDIVVESFSPRVMPSLGLDYTALEKLNPNLVMTSISNFGQSGPYRDFKSSEIVLSAMGSAMRLRGEPDREPMKLAGNSLQYQSGAIASVVTMGALFGSRFKGIGQYIDVSMLETALGSIDQRSAALLAHQYTARDEVAVRLGRSTGGAFAGCPEGIYPCKDGYFDISGGVVWWPRNLALLGNPPELADPKYASQEGQLDPQCQEDILAVFYPWAMSRTKEEIMKAAAEVHALVAPLYTTEDVVNDPHMQERGVFVDIEHPRAGTVKYPGAPFRMEETPWRIIRPAPMLGQHNGEILGELGYSKEQMTRLREAGDI